jgi:hypothetical protein
MNFRKAALKSAGSLFAALWIGSAIAAPWPCVRKRVAASFGIWRLRCTCRVKVY